jgi:two-component system, NarL family, response regulator LiaR
MSAIIRVLLVDDHSQVHRALAVMNTIYPDLQLVAHASNGQQAITLSAEHQPDVIIMDVVMPEMNGIEATRIIHERLPAIRILALSSFQDEESVREMMRVGASGYVLKNSSLEELANSIRAVHSSKVVLSAEITQALLEQKPRPEPAAQPHGLSGREVDVLTFMVKGFNNKQIAQELFISEATVKFHVRNILAKLNVSGRVEAVALAVENNWVR